MTRRVTGRIGVQTTHAMGQPLLDQKIQRAIGNRRLTTKPVLGQALQHLIGTKGAVRFEQYLKRATANRGQADAVLGGLPFGGLQHRLGACRMIVVVKGIDLQRVWVRPTVHM